MQNAATISRERMLDYLFQNSVEEQFDSFRNLHDKAQSGLWSCLTSWFGGRAQ